MFKYFFAITLSICCYGQNEFQIIQSKVLEQKTISNEKFEIFSGDVIAKHKQIILYCDSMLISKKNNFVQAWSNEKSIIKDTNDLIIESKKILFFKNDSIINFKNEVFGKKNNQKIYTEYLSYNLTSQTAYYNKGGKVEDENYLIISDNGEYNLEDKTANFKYNIELKSDDFTILSNDIDIDRSNKTIKFNSRSSIIKDSLIIKGDNGIFRNEKKKLELSGNVHVSQNEKINIYSNYLYDNDSISIFNLKPKLIIKSDNNDSFKITGDEIRINQVDSILFVNNNVYMKNDSIKGKCNKYIYDLKSNKNSLINEPVIFINNQQITGDTIFLFTKNEMIDSIYINNNTFLSSQKNKNYYNQIKGNILQGKFKENKIEYINIIGNGKLKYFNEKDEKIDGVNEVISDEIEIYFKNSQIDKIYFIGQPDANYIPINLLNNNDLFLEGFSIRDSINK